MNTRIYFLYHGVLGFWGFGASFDKRLAIFLYEELIKTGPIIHYSHMEIAKYLGSAREVVSRMLKYFENEGIVRVSRKEIEIIDKKKLMERI